MNKKYLPKSLSPNDKKRQRANILLSRKAYRQGIYIDRSPLSSYNSRQSKHIKKARAMYGHFAIDKTLAKRTKCSLQALKQIYNKGQGAYYSSGSRPNQTSQSWASARVASAITGGKAALVDQHILRRECHPNSPVLAFLEKRRNKSVRK